MKTKPILLVSLIFIIGFILGMLTSAQIRNNKLKPVRQYLSEQRYVEGLNRIIQPTEEQTVEFEAIVKKYGELNGKLSKEFWDSMNSNMELFRKEIDSKLTKEQKTKIEEFEAERQKMFEEFSRNRGDSTNWMGDDRQGYERDYRAPGPEESGDRGEYDRGPRNDSGRPFPQPSPSQRDSLPRI